MAHTPPDTRNPWFRHTSRMSSSPRRLDERREICHRRIAIDAVAQIEDVALTTAGREAATRRFGHLFGRAGPEQLFVHVALENQMWIVFPCRGQVMPSAKTDNVGARRRHQVQMGTFFYEEDARRRSDRGENLLMLRLGPALVFAALE